MSVINQMLKDLQDRSPEPGAPNASPVMTPAPRSSVKLIAITLAVILLCNVVGLYVWFLVSENNALKAENIENNTAKLLAVTAPETVNEVQVAHAKKIEDTSAEKAMVSSTDESTLSNESTTQRALPSKQEIMKYKEEQTSVEDVAATEQPIIPPHRVKAIEPKPKVDKPVITQPTNKAKMLVSSRHFTSAELVQQKLTQAEAAINRNEIVKAEQLFEDILIIDATQVLARKKLAALWFGRQAWQEAVNLLAQGIAISPNNSGLRMLQAQILLKQNKVSLAYQALIPLRKLEQQDYQILLANTAQQVAQYEAAINAYKLLLKMQPNSARWYLGLAIVYDQNSQFDLAIAQYKLALQRGELSTDSASFAQQRIVALGE